MSYWHIAFCLVSWQRKDARGAFAFIGNRYKPVTRYLKVFLYD